MEKKGLVIAGMVILVLLVITGFVVDGPIDAEVVLKSPREGSIENSVVGRSAGLTLGGDFSCMQKIVGDDISFHDAFGVSTDIDSDLIIVGSRKDDPSDSGKAYAFRYQVEEDVWMQEASFTADEPGAFKEFSKSVGVSGDFIFIGEPLNSVAGNAYVFENIADPSWVLDQLIENPDQGTAGRFGMSVAIDGNVAVIGDINDDDDGNNAGAAYVFEYNGASWIETDKLTSSVGSDLDFLGNSVAVYGDVIVVAASRDDNDGCTEVPSAFNCNFGSVTLYRNNGASWIEEDRVTVIDGAPSGDNRFGESVGLYEDILVVGSQDGTASVFRDEGGNWNLEIILTSSEPQDGFGESVAVYGNYIIVGASSSDSIGENSGVVYLYEYSGGVWELVEMLIASDASQGDFFGSSVGLSSEYVVISAIGETINTGAVYIYPLVGCGGGPAVCGDGVYDPESEECDDANNENGDGCDFQCELEFCGDGIINNGGNGPAGARFETEVCDGESLMGESCGSLGFAGGNLGCYTSGAESECLFDVSGCSEPFDGNRVFLLNSQTFDGSDIESVANADDVCKNAAVSNNLGGEDWMAWISDSVSSPSTRFVISGNPYVLLDYSKIADDWTDLTDGSLDHGIYVPETGSRYDVSESQPDIIFTGTRTSGIFSENNCLDWSSNSATEYSVGGISWASDVSFLSWTDIDAPGDQDISCSYEAKIYCFEQKFSVSCPGDTNNDGIVNTLDLTAVILNWHCEKQGNCPDGVDVTGDGIVSVEDLTFVILNWGPCGVATGSGASVPNQPDQDLMEIVDNWGSCETGAEICESDLNGDFVVDIKDVMDWIGNH